MDLTTSMTAFSTMPADDIDTHIEPYDDAMPNSGVVDEADTQNDSAQNNSPQKIDPNAIVLAQALTDTAISWRIHNCKISKKTVAQDLPLPFLYHYDSLDEVIKQANPLTPTLLAQFNTPMTADEAAQLIGIEKELIASPWHVKVTGSLVVFSEALQLAVRLHWTNTY